MDGKDLAKEAVKDVKSMVDLAVSAAKTELVESLAPELKKLIEQKLRGGSKKNEDTDRIRRIKDGYPGESKNEKFEEGAMNDDKDKQEESLASFFAPVTEEEDVTEAAEQVDEGDEKSDDDESMVGEAAEQVDEELEISEDAIRQVYEQALQTEVQVKKGFSDFTKGGDFGKDKPDAAGGIADLKSGEQQWSEADVPAAQDWTVKEVKQLIARGIAENKALRSRILELEGFCRKLNEIAETATKKLTEVNLFNAKLYHAQSFMNEHRGLTKEQRDFVIAKLDKAKTVKEVKSAYETIVESFKVAQGTLNESTSKKPVGNAQRPRKAGGPSQEVLSESVDNSSGGSYWSRARQLAGLKNLK